MAGNLLQFSSGISAFWAPTGVGLAACLAAPYRWWPAILLLLGAVDTAASQLMFDRWFPDDPFKVSVAALLLRRFGPAPFRISSLEGYGRLLVVCAFCFSVFSFFTAPEGDPWTGFWMGDLLGVSMIVPLLLMVQTGQKRPLFWESFLTLAIISVITAALFLPFRWSQAFAVEFPYLLLPMLLWVTIRLPDRVVALSTIVLAAITVYLTGEGLGPFRALPVGEEQSLLLLQSYLLFVTTGPVFLSLGLYERKTASSEELQYRGHLARTDLNYRFLFEASDMAIALLRDRAVVNCNPRFRAMFAARIGDDPFDSAPEFQVDGRPSASVAEEIYLQGHQASHSTPWLTRDSGGEFVETELSLFPLPDSDLLVLTALDVTESKRLLGLLKAERESLDLRVEVRTRELMEANADLVNSVRAKSEMVAHLSHELKTPLTALLAQTDTLLEGLYGPLTDRQLSALREMRDNGARLTRLLSDLLDLHRIEAGQITARPEEFDLGELVRDVLKRAEEDTPRANAPARLDGLDRLTVRSDPRILQRVLGLLIGRAVRRTPRGDQLHLTLEREEQTAVLTVRDGGPPLGDEALHTALDPYAYHSEEENRLETGVSLSVAAGLLASLGGDVAIRGTSMRLTLPLRTP